MEFRPRRRTPVSIDNITPLVDCMCLLLIFFMLSSTFDDTGGIRISLPEGTGDALRREVRDFHVKVDRQGGLFVDKARLTADELSQRFRDTAKTDRNILVVVEADEETPHKHVVGVMDRAKASGLGKLAIATRRKE